MWPIISKILINILISIISDKVVIEAGKKLIKKGVDSTVKNVGIDNKDAVEIIDNIIDSSLNSILEVSLNGLKLDEVKEVLKNTRKY